MFKYGFIMNSENLSPETYGKKYENQEFSLHVAAVSSFEETISLAKKMKEEGIELIDLCGDFNKEEAEKVESEAGVKTCYMKFTEEMAKKLEKTTDLSEYGIIIMAKALKGETVEINLLSDEFNTRLVLVDSDEVAEEAGKKLVKGGITFIELCSYFTLEKMEKIGKAIEGKVPVGYSG